MQNTRGWKQKSSPPRSNSRAMHVADYKRCTAKTVPDLSCVLLNALRSDGIEELRVGHLSVAERPCRAPRSRHSDGGRRVRGCHSGPRWACHGKSDNKGWGCSFLLLIAWLTLLLSFVSLPTTPRVRPGGGLWCLLGKVAHTQESRRYWNSCAEHFVTRTHTCMHVCVCACVYVRVCMRLRSCVGCVVVEYVAHREGGWEEGLHPLFNGRTAPFVEGTSTGGSDN
jgi:hypothetical protein